MSITAQKAESSKPLVSKSSYEQECFDQEALLEKVALEYNNGAVRKSKGRRFGIVWNILFLILGVVVTLFVLNMNYTKAPKLEPGWDRALTQTEEPIENAYFCGHSPDEARSRGCKFDIILYSWVPHQCYDSGIQEEYLQREFEWWRFQNATDQVSQARAREGEEEILWLNWEYHVWHCRHIWKMMTRALRISNLGIPGSLLEYEHTEHCINVLTGDEGYPLHEIGTLVTLNYSTCYTKNTNYYEL